MKKEKKNCGLKKVLRFVGGAALTVAGVIFIPPLMEKYSNKIYKSSLKRDEIDFDNMGPEIVPHDKTKGE